MGTLENFKRISFLEKLLLNHLEGPVSPAEQCDLVGVILENVHGLFQVCRICAKGVVFYHMAQYGLLYDRSLCNKR